MKIRTKEPITFEINTGPYTVPVGKIVKMDPKIGRDLVRQGRAESEPVPYFVREFDQTIMLCNSLEAVERVELEGNLLAFTPYQLYFLRSRRSKEIEAILEVKKTFYGTVILAGMTITRSDIDTESSENTVTVSTENVAQIEKGEEVRNMRHHERFPSHYLTQKDFDEPRTLTIQSFGEEEVKTENGPVSKFVLYFEEIEDRGFIVNSVNSQLLEKYCGDDEDWIGMQIELYTDPSIAFGKKVTGGIRIRPALPLFTQERMPQE